MFFWGMLTGCAVVIVGSILASIILKWQDKRKKGKKQNAEKQNEQGNN